MKDLSVIFFVMMTCTACGGGGASGSSGASGISGVPGSTNAPDMQDMLNVHNQERALVNSIPLLWSDQLADYAQTWANHLANSGCHLVHRTNAEDTLGTGENLAWYSSYGSAPQNIGSARPAQDWAAEKVDYSYVSNSCAAGKACGHYTQMVWNTTLNVGCARSICPDNGQIWVCNYSPPGNYIGVKPY